MRSKALYPSLLAAIVAAFFAAARWLPPIATHAASLAVQAGYTNRTLPLVAILVLGALGLGALAFWKDRDTAVDLQARLAQDAPWPSMRWHVLAGCALCVFVVVAFPVWSSEESYFGLRLKLMDGGALPYRDFEYAYGYAVAYVPYGLHRLGLPIGAALAATLGLAEIAGVVSLALIVRSAIAHRGYRVAIFWGLVVCAAFVGPGPSLNYNFGRYALPFALLAILAREARAFGAARLFAVTAGFTLIVYLVSPEMALAFSCAQIGWLAVAFRGLGPRRAAASAAAVTAVGLGLLLLAPQMFATFSAYAQVQTLLPVVPNPIMILTTASVVGVGALNFAVTLALWTRKEAPERVVALSRAAGFALLAAALLPAVVGRAGPAITLAYGFVSPLMAIGYLQAGGARRGAAALAAVFLIFVAYSAQFGLRHDAGMALNALRTTSATAARPRSGLRAERPAVVQFLKSRFRVAYDPLGVVRPPEPGVTDLGYYPGWLGGDAVTEDALARKAAELARAPYYVLPLDRGFAARLGVAPQLALHEFALEGLYPFALRARPGAQRFGADFIAMLYARCQPAAAAHGVQVCRLAR